MKTIIASILDKMVGLTKSQKKFMQEIFSTIFKHCQSVKKELLDFHFQCIAYHYQFSQV